jgi:hypothetical protein
MLQEINFRGQKALVCMGDDMPLNTQDYKAYSIIKREDENSPIAIQDLMVPNRWGTIFTKDNITFDEYGPDKSPYKRTTLTIDEAMTMMNYA